MTSIDQPRRQHVTRNVRVIVSEGKKMQDRVQVQGERVTWRAGSSFIKRTPLIYSSRLDILVVTALPKY